MTAAKYVDTRAYNVWRTWGQHIPGKVWFYNFLLCVSVYLPFDRLYFCLEIWGKKCSSILASWNLQLFHSFLVLVMTVFSAIPGSWPVFHLQESKECKILTHQKARRKNIANFCAIPNSLSEQISGRDFYAYTPSHDSFFFWTVCIVTVAFFLNFCNKVSTSPFVFHHGWYLHFLCLAGLYVFTYFRLVENLELVNFFPP